MTMPLEAVSRLAQVGGQYRSNDELPPDVRQALAEVPHALDIWRAAYNAAAKDPKYADQATAFQVAWAAVARKFEKGADGKWRAKNTAAAADEPELVTVPDVELVRAGTWRASTGIVTVTPDHLTSMAAAAIDPEVDGAGIRIGHVDPRFDGEPALGWVRNVRVVGDRIRGDLVDVPRKLAEAMKSAYRRRSVEIAWGVRTPSGKRYSAALAGLALLGITPPAVKGLADVLSGLPGGTVAALFTDSAEGMSALSVADDVGDYTEVARLEDLRARAFDVAEASSPDSPVFAAALDALSALTAPLSATPAPVVGQTDPGTDPGGRIATVLVDDNKLRELLARGGQANVDALIASIRAETPPPPAPGSPGSPTPSPADPGAPPPAGPGQPNPTPGPTPGQPGGPAQPPAPGGPAPTGQPTGPAPAPAQPAPAPAPAPGQPAPAPAPAQPAPSEPGSPEASGDRVLAALSALDQRLGRIESGQMTGARDTVLRSALAAGRIPPEAKALKAWDDQLARDYDGTVALLNAQPAIFSTGELGSGAAVELGTDQLASTAWDSFESSMFGNDASYQAAVKARNPVPAGAPAAQ